jgi:hypothetical protein
MYLTVACPGWLKQSAGIPPDPPNDVTIEGEVAHWVAKVMADGDGEPLTDRTDITEEMLDGAAVWVQALEGYPARLEERLLGVHELNWGTPDATQWNPARKIHRAADYKFGHEFVDEFENWQLLNYTVMSINRYYPQWRSDPEVKFEMTVVQPRYYGKPAVRTWTIQTAGLLHYEQRIKAAIEEAESNKPRVISGTHCTHCPARVDCPTFGRTIMHAVDFAGRPDPVTVTPLQVGNELLLVQESIKRLEARETGLKARAETMIKAGQRVPHYSIEQGLGNLAWTGTLEEIEMLARLRGKTALKPPALITPTQARDRKILADTVVKAYAERPKTGFKLVRDTTNRSFKK